MRTWVKASIIGVSLVVLAFAALAGTGAYYVLRNLDTHSANEAAALGEFQAIRTRFGTRPPLIEVVDPRVADIRMNRPTEPDGRPVSTFHVLTWTAEDREVFKTAAPIWLLRFSSVNVLSQLRVAPERFRLTVQDIERYGPGVVVDYARPGKNRVLVWVD